MDDVSFVTNVTNVTDLGNTKNRSVFKGQALYWCFTLSNYTDVTVVTIVTIFEHECKWFLFQEEMGENGTIHLQGTVCFNKKKRFEEVKKIDPKIHWEKTKSVKASILYCQKKETRIGKIYSKGIDIPEEIEVDEPYGWQTQVVDIIKEKPDKRSIWWFWEANGNVGKSTLCKYLKVKYDAVKLSGKANDMFHILSKKKNKKIIIIDVPRHNLDYVNYGAIEEIKNGYICSGKYDGDDIVFNAPHVICFANEPPKTERMSADRWRIVEIQ